jgi:hypothetical protein
MYAPDPNCDSLDPEPHQMYRAAILAVAMFASSLPLAVAQDAEKSDVAKPPKEKKVCRREVATGSMLPHSTCRTKAEWDAIDARNQANATQALDRRHSMSGNQ